jgi:hypothetical protein
MARDQYRALVIFVRQEILSLLRQMPFPPNAITVVTAAGDHPREQTHG